MHNKRMQSDLLKSYTSCLAVDAERYVADNLISGNKA